MRLLIVAWRDLANSKAGGSEAVVDALAIGLQDRGHHVTVLCGGPIGARPYSVIRCGGTYSQYLFAPIHYWRNHRDVDLVIDVVNGLPFWSPLWRRSHRLAVLFHVHGEQWHQYFPKPIARIMKWVERRLMPVVYRNTNFATISQSTITDLQSIGIKSGNLHLLELGANVELDGPAVDRSPTPMFVALGRVAPNKRLDLLLDHWAVVGGILGGNLHIIGDGPDLIDLQRRCAEDGRLAGVIFEGRVDEARKSELLQRAWLLVHAADREGWGIAIIEAALCGTPTLAYRVPGVRDAVEDQVTGILVDTAEEFRDAWKRVGNDATHLRGLGEQAKVRASTYSWKRTVNQFEAIARIVGVATDLERAADPLELDLEPTS